MQTYEIKVNGVSLAVQLNEKDAKRLGFFKEEPVQTPAPATTPAESPVINEGDKSTEEKQAETPENKQAPAPANKAAANTKES